jgi:hypothetical protein
MISRLARAPATQTIIQQFFPAINMGERISVTDESGN